MPSAQKAYRQFFDILLSHQENDGAVLFHCTAGKDRTGMGAVYLLSALGVDGHTIRQDYLATNDLIQPMVEKILLPLANAVQLMLCLPTFAISARSPVHFLIAP